MNLSWVRPLLMTTQKTVIEHAPQILMVLGTTGVTGAVIYGAKAGEKSVYLIEQAEVEKAKRIAPLSVADEDDAKWRPWREPLTWQEKIKACWKVYVPPVGLLIFGVGCFWGAQGINLKRQAVLAGLYATAEANLHEYQAKVVEMIGKDGEKEVNAAIQQDKADRLPPPPAPVIVGGAETWCLIDNQYFRNTYTGIKDAQNIFNQNMISQMYGSKLELYWLLDPDGKYLKPDENAGEVGWSVDKLLVLDIDPVLGPNHEQILAISYRDDNGLLYAPEPGFGRLY